MDISLQNSYTDSIVVMCRKGSIQAAQGMGNIFRSTASTVGRKILR